MVDLVEGNMARAVVGSHLTVFFAEREKKSRKQTFNLNYLLFCFTSSPLVFFSPRGQVILIACSSENKTTNKNEGNIISLIFQGGCQAGYCRAIDQHGILLYRVRVLEWEVQMLKYIFSQ